VTDSATFTTPEAGDEVGEKIEEIGDVEKVYKISVIT